MKIAYRPNRLRSSALAVIDDANVIIEEYQAAGYDLTLRQLYYQFVARGLLPNEQAEYKRLGSIINDGRLAGLVSWQAIEDRTRNLERLPTWRNPESMVTACAEQFRVDVWREQPIYVEVWVEKEALAGVVERACTPLRVPYFCCRGYVSQSEMWAAAQRFPKAGLRGTLIVHLGDHDPSGIDMTRDIKDRLAMFADHRDITVMRVALNRYQVDEHNPPPNPAKVTDSRFEAYRELHGDESWELDALPPDALNALITETIEGVIDRRAWEFSLEKESHGRRLLVEVGQILASAKEDRDA